MQPKLTIKVISKQNENPSSDHFLMIGSIDGSWIPTSIIAYNFNKTKINKSAFVSGRLYLRWYFLAKVWAALIAIWFSLFFFFRLCLLDLNYYSHTLVLFTGLLVLLYLLFVYSMFTYCTCLLHTPSNQSNKYYFYTDFCHERTFYVLNRLKKSMVWI